MAPELSRRDILRTAKGLALATPFLGLIACDGWRSGVTAFAGPTMGTDYKIKITDLPWNIDRTVLKSAFEGILKTVNDQMSNWRAESEISAFNAKTSPSWFEISTDTRSVIDEALRIGRLSGGAFDPTIGPLVDLWGFGPERNQFRIPHRDEIATALQRTGYRHIRTKSSRPGIAKHKTGMEINLCGIAKGFGVDKLAEHLDSQGIDRYLVEIGGELRARGYSSRGGPWRIGVERRKSVV